MVLPLVLQEYFQKTFGSSPDVRSRKPLSGGMVNRVEMWELDGPPGALVLKTSPETERLALEEKQLRFLKQQGLPVPEVYGFEVQKGMAFLFLQKLPGISLNRLSAEKKVEAEKTLAEHLRKLHSHRRKTYGRVEEERKYSSWAAWYLARCAEEESGVRKSLPPGDFARLKRLLEKVTDAFAPAEEPRLVHGDLWATNILVQPAPDGVFITGFLDPKAEWTDVGFETAYLEIFHTVGQAFFKAYGGNPAEGPNGLVRRALYFLHTLLVHIDRFQEPVYVKGALEVMRDLENLLKIEP